MLGKKKSADVVIAGGGAGGLSLALLLAGAGLDVHIIDPVKMPPPKDIKPTGRTVALLQGSLNILEAAGVWPGKLREKSGALRLMRIIDDSRHNADTIEIDFEAAEMGIGEYGHNVPTGLLVATLAQQAAKAKNITIHCDTLADYTVEDNQIIARTDGGLSITAPLIVGADGRNSKVREVASIETAAHDYGQSAITCLVNHSRAHDNVATEFHRESGPLAFVPLPGNVSSIV